MWPRRRSTAVPCHGATSLHLCYMPQPSALTFVGLQCSLAHGIPLHHIQLMCQRLRVFVTSAISEDDSMRVHTSRVVAGCRRQPLESKTDASVAVALVALTALWIALAVVDTGRSHVRRRSYWFSLLIGALRIT